MRARDLILIARQRAGLTQHELGQRIGAPQVTVSRWESGATEPKFKTVQDVVAACELDLTIGLATADGGSWLPLIHEQLRREPAERVRHLTYDRFDRVAALELVGAVGVRALVVGEVAGALHGWPLILSHEGTLDLVVHPGDRELASDTVLNAAIDPDRIRLVDQPAGTRGYADLARRAVSFTLEGQMVSVAGLVDLLRIALTDRGSDSERFALAFDATLELASRVADRDDPSELTSAQARVRADAWLAKQNA
jgi:transcriptional regulator with XRE-family HTH domain